MCRARLAGGRQQRSARHLDSRIGTLQFLGANGLRGQQRLAARQLGLGLLQLELAALHLCIDLRGLLALLADLAHGQRQRAGGPCQRDQIVGRIQAQQHLAALDALRVIGLHGHHGARGLRRHTDLIARHIGIVRGLAEREHQPPQYQPADGDHGEYRGDDQQYAAALAVAAMGIAARGWLTALCCFVHCLVSI